MLANDIDGIQLKVTGPTGAIRKCILTEECQKSWGALEQEVKTLHGLNGQVCIHYLDDDNDLIAIDSDAELATLLKHISRTKATSIKMTVAPAFPSTKPNQYNSTDSMASFRTQDSFSGAIPAPDNYAGNSTDSWRFRADGSTNSFNSQHQHKPLSQAMDYNSQASEYSSQPVERQRQDSDAGIPKMSIAREAAYKAAIEANNAARRAFEEQKQAAKANREQIKSARKTGGSANDLPAYE